MIDRFDSHQAMQGFTAATRKRRRWTLTKFSESVDLQKATREDVERFISARSSPASRRSLLADLRQFYGWANDRGLIDTNPTEGVPSVKVPTRQARPLSPNDLARVLEAARRSRSLLVAVMLAAYAGLRVSEIAALAWSDVRADEVIVRGGKGGKDRGLPLANELADALAELPRRDDGRVIGTSGANVSQRIRRMFQRLEIDHRPHDLRATFGTQVAHRHGILTAQRMLGHTSVATTQAYLGWTPYERGALDGLYSDAA